jgi:hypothetical protein
VLVGMPGLEKRLLQEWANQCGVHPDHRRELSATSPDAHSDRADPEDQPATGPHRRRRRGRAGESGDRLWASIAPVQQR